MLPRNRDQILERIRKFREETLAATIAVGGRVAAQAVHRGREVLRDVVLPTFEEKVLPRVKERFPTLAQLLEEWKRKKIDGYLLDIMEESEESVQETAEPSPQDDGEMDGTDVHDSGEQDGQGEESGPEESVEAAPESEPTEESEPAPEPVSESQTAAESTPELPGEQPARQEEGPAMISHDVLESAFSRNQLFKVLYLMNEVEKQSDGEGWMMAKDVSAKGEELGFHIRPGNVRKVLRQKAIPRSLVVWREKPDGRSRARQYALTDDGRSHLKELISELA